MYLGPEDPVEKEAVLNSKLKQAKENGMSELGIKELEGMLREYDDVIKLKLGDGQLADIEPLSIQLKPDAVPVRANQRQYTLPNSEFMIQYVDQILNMGFVKNVTSPEWVSAPLIVLKRPPTRYRLKIDYRPVN